MNARIILMLFVAVAAVSSASLFVVLAAAPGIVAAFWRLAFSLPILYLSRPRILRSYLPLLAGFALALHFGLWMESLFHASVAVSTTIVCTHALFSGFFAYLWGEKPKFNHVVGVIVALIGIYFMSGADTSSEPVGILLALLGAIAGGFYFASARRARQMDFASYVFTTYLSAALFCLIFALAGDYNLVGYDAKTWMFFALLAVIPMLVGHTLLNYVLRRMDVIPVTASVIGEAVGAALLAAVFLGQKLSVQSYIYMAVVLCGIAITLLPSPRQIQRQQRAWRR